MGKPESPARSVIWVGLKSLSMEHLILARIKSGWNLKGTIISKIGKRAYTFKYVIYADRLFKTRRVRVSEVTSRSVRNLSIDFIGPAVFVNGKIRADFASCSDVDFEISPATNTLPIKRLRLGLGQRAEVRVAWVRFPSLEVKVLEQSYERIDTKRYVYRSQSGFQADISVDSFGLITRYDEIWRRVYP